MAPPPTRHRLRTRDNKTRFEGRDPALFAQLKRCGYKGLSKDYQLKADTSKRQRKLY